MHVLIVGAGAIGTCTAYYLSRRPEDVRVTVVERTGVACASSGKAGGFLWSEGDGELSLTSYGLHARLATVLDGERFYGYRKLDTYSVTMTSKENAAAANKTRKVNDTVPWLYQERVTHCDQLGSKKETAQVHPRLFTTTLMTAAEATGNVKLLVGNGVKELLYDDDDSTSVIGVLLDNGDKILADRVVMCMGPWSGLFSFKKGHGQRAGVDSEGSSGLSKTISKTTDGLPILSARAHSIVMRMPKSNPIGAQALFTAILDGSKMHEPEVYPRSDNTVYMCGCQDKIPLPQSADLVQADPKSIALLKHLAGELSPHLDTSDDNIMAEQACYLPISRDGSPLVGKHPNYNNLYISTGHSVWGILMSPVSGLMITELLVDNDITCVSPSLVARLSLDSRFY